MTDRDVILLTDFVNKTGDDIFDGTLKQALSVQLGQSPFLSFMPDPKIQKTLKLMGRSPDQHVTDAVAREVCQRANIKALLEGSISKLGRNYAIALVAVNCQTGETLAEEQVEAEGKETVLRAVGTAATNIRSKLGESLTSIQKLDTPIAQATTPSLDALKAYSVALKEEQRGETIAAIALLKRALDFDPTFASAHAQLGRIYGNLREFDQANQHKIRAFELRDRVSEPERIFISAMYYGSVSGEFDKAIEAFQAYKSAYPRDYKGTNLAVTNNWLGFFDKALPEARHGVQHSPEDPIAWGVLGWTLINSGALSEAKGVFDKALAAKLDESILGTGLYLIAEIQGDAAGMKQTADWVSDSPDGADVLQFIGGREAMSGRLHHGRVLIERAAQTMTRAGLGDAGALALEQVTVFEAAYGNVEPVRTRIAREHDRASLITIALALAVAGVPETAQVYAADLERRWPKNILVNALWVPSIRAAVELNLGRGQRAVELLDVAAPYELGVHHFFPRAAIYLRGQAYLMLHDAPRAIAQFQKVLDHPYFDPPSPFLPLAYVGLARAYVMAGDVPKARKAYEDFFNYWKDADPDVPVLLQAKREYAALVRPEARSPKP